MYAPHVIRPKVHWPTALVVISVMTIVAGGLIIALFLGRQWPIPALIKAQVEFPVFMPTSGVKLDQSSYRFDKASGVLSFTGQLYDGQSVTFAEQATPGSFTDIPNFYQKFLQTLYTYQSFDSLNGTVNLTHPKDAGQAAVMSSKGTLLFVRVAADETIKSTKTEIWLGN